jgi:hypothetical protein
LGKEASTLSLLTSPLWTMYTQPPQHANGLVDFCASTRKIAPDPWRRPVPPRNGTLINLHLFLEIIHSLLHPYIDLPKVTRLNWTFVAALQNAAWNDGRIHDHRRRDWLTHETSEEGVAEHVAPLGFLMQDFRLALVPAAAGRIRSVSVEFNGTGTGPHK